MPQTNYFPSFPESTNINVMGPKLRLTECQMWADFPSKRQLLVNVCPQNSRIITNYDDDDFLLCIHAGTQTLWCIQVHLVNKPPQHKKRIVVSKTCDAKLPTSSFEVAQRTQSSLFLVHSKTGFISPPKGKIIEIKDSSSNPLQPMLPRPKCVRTDHAYCCV